MQSRTIQFISLALIMAGFIQAQDHLNILSSNTTFIIRGADGYQPGKELKNAGSEYSVQAIFPDLNLWSVKFDKKQSLSRLKSILAENKLVLEITPNYTAEWRNNPNDPDFSAQWTTDNIALGEVWDLTTGGTTPDGTEIVIAVFDDGYQVDHIDLKDNIWVNEGEIPDNGVDDDNNGFTDDFLGWNATEENDKHRIKSHGTSVAGIIGARGDNNLLIAGINWEVKLMLTSAGRGENISLVDIVKAYNYIYTQRKLFNDTGGNAGAYVVVSNYSGGAPNLFPSDFPSWCEIYDLLGQEGVLNISSAPNTNTNVDIEGDLPSTCPSEFLIAVTNTNILDRKVENAGFGPLHIDLGAPGEGVFTLGLNDGTDPNFTGASASAPHVAGVIGLLYSVICEDAYNSSITSPSEVALVMRDAILVGVDPNQTLSNITSTGGRLNAANSMDLILNTLGDCCRLQIEEVVSEPETCLGSDDGSIQALAEGELLQGDILYTIDGIGGTTTDTSGSFIRLTPGTYPLTIYDGDNPGCFLDTSVIVRENAEVCSLGDFEIVQLRPNPASEILELEFQIDELKVITLQIHDNLGRLVLQQRITPGLAGSRVLQIPVGHLSTGTYHASIQATGRQEVDTFVISR